MTKKTGFVILAIILLHVVVLMVILGKRSYSGASPVSIKRYEIALMEIDTNRIEAELHRLYEEFPLFLEGADLDDGYNQRYILDLVKDSRSKDLLADILNKYPDLRQLEQTLGQSFATYDKLFGRREQKPMVYTYLSYLDYDNRVIFMDSVLVIAIDMYLGANYSHYDAAALPMYIRQRLDAPFIAVDAMKAVAHYELERAPQPLNTLLDYMILNGKVTYFLEKTLPDVDDATRFGYTLEQMAWCNKSEEMMWSYLVGNRLLYEQDNFKYRSFVQESPTVQVFPGSPGRVGHFLGYQIVKDYMENTGQTLPELFANKDAQQILKQSNYRP